MCDIIAFLYVHYCTKHGMHSRMTNLHRPLSIGRAVAPMCVLAYGGFARAALRLACGLACRLARAQPSSPSQFQVSSLN